MSEEKLVVIEIDNIWSEDVKEVFEKINNSSSNLQQLKHFKEFNDKKLDNNVLSTFINLYFTLKIKHQIKNCIRKILMETKEEEEVLPIICESIKKRIESLDTFDDRYHFVNCIIESTQGFKLLFKALVMNQEILMKFFLTLLKKLKEELLSEKSPSEKLQISKHIHVTIQAIMCCFKNHLDNNFKNDQDFEVICELFIEFISYDEVLMDTKYNCGALIVMRNELMGVKLHFETIKDQNENFLKKLCIINGISLVCDVEDLEIWTEMCEILNNIYSKNSVDPLTVLAVSRLFVQISKKLQESKLLNVKVAKIIANFSFSNIENNVDSVKHLSKHSLRNLMESKDVNIANLVFEKINSTSSISTCAVIIQSILPATTVDMILSKLPNLLQLLLSSIQKHKDNIISCYDLISSKYYKELNSFEAWFEKIIQPIINEMKRNKEARDDLRTLISLCIKIDVNAVDKMLKNREDFDGTFVLMCLNSIKKSGSLNISKSTLTSWRGVITYDEIKNFINNFDDEVRFSAFQLLVDTRKSTEEFNDQEIECIFYFYERNVNIQNATIRQSIIGMTKQLFERLQNLICVYRRKNDEQKVEKIYEVLVKFQKFSIDNLIDDSNYSRRLLSLKILQNTLEVLKLNFPNKSLWNQKQFNSIMNLFHDNFETIKSAAVEILNFIPRETLVGFSQITLRYLERLMTSIKSSDALVAAYLLEFVINFSLFEFSHDESSEYYSTSFSVLIWCEKILGKSLNIAKKSIIISGGNNTLYGPLLCIRQIILKLDFNNLKDCPKWKAYFSRLISICREISSVVAPIVNNCSPEGLYPKEKNIEKFNEDDLRILKNTTPQMVLINAWRTIKEISLFLGDISLRGSSIILDTADMLEIADHLLQLMTKTKHRGAFEQAFNGFTQLCYALRLSHDPQLHNLPTKILENLITSISGNNNEEELGHEMKNLCATRRSAGLPFIVQALIISEMKIVTNNNFHFVMRNLLIYARQGKHLETRVHSLNILRTLFRCKELNEGIMEYVGDAIQCSLIAYDAEIWSERNSATLLFSALMIRIFGPQRTKNNEELNVRNKMNAKIFFLRFPELFKFFKELLHQAENKVNAQKKNAKLHPLLLLLNRLYNSNNEEENSIKLTEFIPNIVSCSACVELQTRILCAQFIASNMPPNCVMKTILSDIKSCRVANNLTANAKHGKLLTMVHLSKRECVTEGESLEILKEIFELFKHFEGQTINEIILLDITIECVSKLESIGSELSEKIDGLLKLSNSNDIGVPLIPKRIIALCLLKSHFDWIMTLNPLNFYELQDKLNCLLLILDYDFANQVMDEYELDMKICELIGKLKSVEVKIKIQNNFHLKASLKEIIKNGKNFVITVRSFEILSYLTYEKGEWNLDEINSFVKNAIDKPQELCNAMLKYARTCLANEDKKYLASICWDFLEEITESSSYITKLSTLDLLQIIAINISIITDIKSLFYFTKSVLNLLMDDDSEVRFSASRIISEISNHKDFYIASHAQYIFMEHIEKCCDKNKFLTVIILLAHEQTRNGNQDEIEDEFQVFEHNESNTFKERFMIRRLCTSILSKDENILQSQEEKLKIVNAFREIKRDPIEELEILKFIESFR